MSLTRVSYSMIEGAAVNVLDYGADNTGSTNSYAAITAAMAAASAISAGSKFGVQVYLPPGNYLIGTTLAVPSGVQLVGNGAALLPTGAISTMILVEGLRQNVSGLTIYIPNGGIGIDCRTHWSTIYDNFFFANSANATNVTCIKLSTTDGNDGSWLTDIIDNAMDFNQYSSTSSGCIGIDLLGPQNRINIMRNAIAGFGGKGIQIRAYSPSIKPQSINIFGNDIESLGGSGTNYGLYIINCNNVNVIGNYFEAIANTNSQCINAGVDNQSRNLTITNNYFLHSGAVGEKCIALNKVSAPTIGDNYWDGANVDYITITSNTLIEETALQRAPISTYNLLAQQSASFQTPGTSYVRATDALVNNAIILPNNIYNFYIYFEASAADTYHFKLTDASGATTIAEVSKTTASSGLFSASILFAAPVGSLDLYVKTTGASQVKFFVAQVQSI